MFDYGVPLTIFLCMVTVPYIMVGLERILDYRGVGLARFHCSENLFNQDQDEGSSILHSLYCG